MEKKPNLQENLKKILGIFYEYSEEALKEDTVLNLLEDPHGIERGEGLDLIGILMRDGMIFSPRPGRYKLTGGA